ncbi:NPCBM/NEW2 domain-containing protein [Candidatus Aminicenantes bacterium AH-873-B07]|nr:NPCBM/NEW2 domain-containing protein [Candidatus Aminicenantes bacterium AH-873-B07]
MKMIFKKELSILSLLFIIFLIPEINLFSKENKPLSKNPSFKIKKLWPYPIPCRIKDGENKDLFIMTLGDIETPLADGIFYPVQDKVILKDGKEINNYFKNVLKIKYFKPIDKSAFPLPPSGWCSWYYYYQEISENEVIKNAKWLSENLKDYGAAYCQIDDGWQGRGHGLGDNRDWTTIDKRFPSGMDGLAKILKKLGLKPGIWLAPHGQSNEDVVRKSGAFMLTKNGKSASSTWVGDYLLDPTKKKAIKYLENLFTTLASKWGYEYFKIDGQPIVINEYKTKTAFMENPKGNPEEFYRKTLFTIRNTIGPNRYLLGCWGIPLLGVGIMNGSRTGGDVRASWEGFIVALDATMKYYFLHNIVWYCDPDVMLVRAPLTLDMARVWATLQGLTGQALMASDRLYDLPEERVEILKRVFPAVDIRPLDLFPSNRYKKIWDLKINRLGRKYDVVGLFNFDEEKSKGIFLKWSDLGLPNNSLIHVFDFWNKEYLGCWEKGIYLLLSPASCKVLTLMEAKNKPQIISTSRHITQGWLDLKEISFNEKKMMFKGKSILVKNDPYEIRFAFPRTKETYRIKEAKVNGEKVQFFNYQGWAKICFSSLQNEEVSWEVYFEPTEIYTYPVNSPRGIEVEFINFDGVKICWTPLYALNAGYMVYLDNELLGYTPINQFEIYGLNLEKEYKIEVYGVWFDGTMSKKSAEVKFKLKNLLPDEIFLSDVEPISMSAGWRTPKMNKAISGLPLKIGNTIYKRGIGTHAPSEIIYNINGQYNKFIAIIGVDSHIQKDKGSVEFKIYGDGKLLWESGLMRKKDLAKKIELDITGIKTLCLEVEDGGDGKDWDHANWAEAKIRK